MLSYAWRSLPVLLLARLLNGLGSARAANRRYTADYVSGARRTIASAGAGPHCLRLCRHCSACQSGAGQGAGPGTRRHVLFAPQASLTRHACSAHSFCMHLPAAFVGASNLGMALGPLLSLPLAYLPDGRQVAGLPVNSITAVGWIMAAAWLAFLLATIA